MTISTSVNRVVGQGNGATTAFSYSFLIPVASNAVVTFTDTTGVQTVLANTQYSLTGVGNPNGGTINYPLVGSPMSAGQSITLVRILSLQQLTSLINQGAYYPAVVEGALDNLEMQIQQIGATTSGNISIQFPLVDPLTLNATLPSAALRANYLLGFDSLGNVVTVAPTSGSAAALASDLLNGTIATKGAGQVGFGYALAYSAGTAGRWLQDLATSSGASFVGASQATVYPAATLGAKFNQFPSVRDAPYSADSTGVVDATAAIKSALQAGYANLWFPPGTYKVGSIDATLTANLTIWGYGATLLNTTQVAAAGVPILRIRAGAALGPVGTFDVNVIGLTVTGPRVTVAYTNVTPVSYAGCTYEGNGYPSGIDIKVARNALVTQCRVTGTYYTGIEAHYCNEFVAEKNDVENHGYAGILWSDVNQGSAVNNDVFDIGTVIVTDGYGITANTSYNPTPGLTWNDSVYVAGNRVRYCKRKPIDVHSGLDVRVIGNQCKGFGNSGIYAVCEDNTKRVGHVTIADNHILGDTTFAASASALAIDVGQFGAAVIDNSSFTITGNKVYNLVATGMVGINNSTTAAKSIQAALVSDNEAYDCTFVNMFSLSNNVGSNFRKVSYKDNVAGANTVVSGVAFLTAVVDQVSVEGNDLRGTYAGGLFQFDSLVGAYFRNNTLNGALQADPTITRDAFTSGHELSLTQELSGVLANVNLLAVDLGVQNDATWAADVEVLVTGSTTTGLVRYRTTVFGTRTGAAAAVFTPAAATAMTLDATIYGALTAPKLQCVVVGNTATLQFQPQQTFATSRIRVRSQTWRANVTAN